MIQARNTYNIEIDRSTAPEKYTVALFIWKGDKNTPPTNAEYSITKNNIQLLTTDDYIGISDIIRDFIEPTIPTFIEGLNNYNNAIWVKYQVFLNDDIVASQEDTLLFVDGFTDTTNNILLDGYELTMYDSFLIPVTAGSTYTVLSYPSNQINTSYELAVNDESSEQIEVIKITRPSIDTYIRVSDGTNEVYIYPEQKTRLGNTVLTYINSKGVYQQIPFFGEKRNSIEVNKEVYRVGSSLSGHTYTQFNTNARTEIKLKSGYHTEGTNKAIESLFLSEYVWLGDDFTAVNIESKTLDYKTRVNDKVINYDITLKESFDKINTL